MAREKLKVLIIGASGYIGRHIAAAAARMGHPTFALVRDPSTTDETKARIFDNFKASGITLIKGDLYDRESLVNAIKQVDVVISAVGYSQLKDQTLIVDAIKEAGNNIKRFFPSEFGNDVDRVHAVEPAKSFFSEKAQVRRAVEASGIPYTFVSSNFFAGIFLPNLGQAVPPGSPDKVIIYGDGNAKAIFVDEDDIGTYAINALEDPRTLNKILYIRPPANILSQNDLVSIWQKKTGKILERVYVPEEEILKQISEASLPLNRKMSIAHSVFIKGDHTNFEIEPSFGVEATQLYPDVKYTTVDEYLNHFL